VRAGEGRPSRVVTTSHQWERDGHIPQTTDGVLSSVSATVQMGTAGWVQLVMDVDDGSAVEATNILSRSSIFKMIKDIITKNICVRTEIDTQDDIGTCHYYCSRWVPLAGAACSC